MTPEEEKAYHDTFVLFDRDGNGTIDLDELQIGLAEQRGADFAGSTTAVRALEHLLDRFDANRDGVLQRDEFVALLASDELGEFFEQSEQRPSAEIQNIYGQAPTPPETEESVKTGLVQLQAKLDAMEGKLKRGFNQALEKCPELMDDAFRLMFLRTEVFDAKLAAQRLVTYWDNRIKLFGAEKAFRPLTQDGALADDAVTLSLGFLRPTGQSDPAGRAVLFMDFSREGKADYTPSGLIRAVWYAIHAALDDDRAQKRGLVILVKASDSLRQWDMKTSKEMASHMRGTLPFRLGCFHVCHPPGHIDVVLKISRLFLPKKLRGRIRKHRGTQEEVLESLADYGIPATAVPDIWGGELEYEDRFAWLEARRSIEDSVQTR